MTPVRCSTAESNAPGYLSSHAGTVHHRLKRETPFGLPGWPPSGRQKKSTKYFLYPVDSFLGELSQRTITLTRFDAKTVPWIHPSFPKKWYLTRLLFWQRELIQPPASPQPAKKKNLGRHQAMVPTNIHIGLSCFFDSGEKAASPSQGATHQETGFPKNPHAEINACRIQTTQHPVPRPGRNCNSFCLP